MPSPAESTANQKLFGLSRVLSPERACKPFFRELMYKAFSTIYNIFFKRNSIFVGTVFASSFVFQAAFDSAVTSWYEQHNKGKLWKDVKAKLAQGGDDDDEDDEDDE